MFNNYQVALLMFGILLLLIGLVGKVKAKELEVGTSNRVARAVIAAIGALFVVVSFNPGMVTDRLQTAQAGQGASPLLEPIERTPQPGELSTEPPKTANGTPKAQPGPANQQDPIPSEPTTDTAKLVPLQLWWHSERGDNFSTATAAGANAAKNAGYNKVREQARVFSSKAPGTVPLYLFWHSQRGDNFTTATTTGINAAKAAGYSQVRVEGYVYPTQKDGLVPLKLYWHSQRADNFTAATSEGINAAEAAGYKFIRIEGYAKAKSKTDTAELVPLQLWWQSERGDNLSTATAAGANAAKNAGYNKVREQARVFSSKAPGTVPLYLFWHSQRGDNFTTATTTGINAAKAAGYSQVRVEGYVYPTQKDGLVPLKLYWHSQREDNFTAATSEGINAAEAAGYKFVRVEAYAKASK